MMKRGQTDDTIHRVSLERKAIQCAQKNVRSAVQPAQLCKDLGGFHVENLHSGGEEGVQISSPGGKIAHDLSGLHLSQLRHEPKLLPPGMWVERHRTVVAIAAGSKDFPIRAEHKRLLKM